MTRQCPAHSSQADPHRTRLRQVAIAVFPAYLAAVAVGCGHADNPSKKGDNSDNKESDSGSLLMRVTPIRPERKKLIRWTEQPGQIQAFEETPVYAKVAGYVEKMHVDIGDPITGPQLDESGKVVRE